MARFALALHPDKTRLIEFGRHAAADRERRGLGKPETFNLLGLTHICGRTRRGGVLLRRKSRRGRMRAKLHDLKGELRRRWHDPIPAQGEWLKRVVTGWYNYHAVPTNIAALSRFRHHVSTLWMRALPRRSPRGKTTWREKGAIEKPRPPSPRIPHPRPRLPLSLQ